MTSEENKYDNPYINSFYVEAIAKTFYNLTIEESKRTGLHEAYGSPNMTYEEIEPEAKEYYRIFARYIMKKVSSLIDVVEFYGEEKNWSSQVINDEGEMDSIKDGIIFDDSGDKARKILKDFGYLT